MYLKTLLAALVAAAVGVIGGFYWGQLANPPHTGTSVTKNDGKDHRQPLYWVAPMDASFRRDGPGKSPMGMDLVPVYADDKNTNEADVRVSPAVEQHLGLTTAEVRERSLSPAVKATGFVSFNEQTLSHFHLRATGWVSNLSVNAVGDPVEAGQKLFDFYSPDIRNTQQEFLQALASGDSGLIRASRAKLTAQGVPDKEINEIAKHRQLTSNIAYFANTSGVVAELNVANGSYVSLEQNTLSVGPLESVWVIAEVFERQAGLLTAGLAVDITSRAYPGRTWRGQIDYIYPVVNPANRTTRARIVVENTDVSLRPNMLTEVLIHTARQEPHLTVPENSVIRTGRGERVVREVAPGVFRTTVVSTGISAKGYTEILHGLNVGDKVVTNAQFLIDSESSIHIELERFSQPENIAVDHSGMHDSAQNNLEMNHADKHHTDRHHNEMNHSSMDHSQHQNTEKRDIGGGEL